MNEYYSELFNDASIYKLDEKGNIYHLNTVALTWEEVSGVINFDYSWNHISEEVLHEMMLDFYITTSKYLLSIELTVNKTYKIKKRVGDHFRFLQLCSYVLAIDENDNQYTCNVDMMLPTREDVIKNLSFQELKKSEVIEKIREQEVVDISNMELYKDLNGDFIALNVDTTIYKLSHYTGELTQCVQKITKTMDTWVESSMDEISSLPLEHKELTSTSIILQERYECEGFLEKPRKKYKRDHKKDIGELIFYRNPYGKVYAKNEKGIEVECTEEAFFDVPSGTIEKEWERIKGEYVKNDIVLYSQRNEENKRDKKITLFDLNLYYNLANEICGISETGDVYKMNSKNGTLRKVKPGMEENKVIRGCEVIKAVKKQAELIYYNELNSYINKCEKVLIKDGYEGFGETITFYGRLLDTDIEVYAMDSHAREYICDINSITPIARGTINESFIEYQDKFVLNILKFENQAIKERLLKNSKKFKK